MATHLHEPVAEKDGLSLYFVGDVAVIVINKGENRFNINVINNLHFLLDEVERKETCKGLVTTGKDRFFSNGLDIPLMKTLTPEENARTFASIIQLLKRILLFPIPTVAAINGHAFGGGAFLAYAHDLRVMRNDRGWLSINEVFLDMGIDHSILELVRSKIGNGQHLTDSVVLGARYTAHEACRLGMVHAVSSESLLITESMTLLKSFSGKVGYSRKGLSKMKKDVYLRVIESFDKFHTQLNEREYQIARQKRIARL